MTLANNKILYKHFISKGMTKQAEEQKARILKREPTYFDKPVEVKEVKEVKEDAKKSKGK